MLGASARLSCLHTPVETSTPPCRRGKLHIPRSRLRRDLAHFAAPPLHREPASAGLRDAFGYVSASSISLGPASGATSLISLPLLFIANPLPLGFAMILEMFGQAPYRAFPPPAKTYSLRCSTFSGQTRFAGLCPDLGRGNTAYLRQLARLGTHTVWGIADCRTRPSDSLHCSISVRRIVLHFCNV